MKTDKRTQLLKILSDASQSICQFSGKRKRCISF